ncbi:TetR family transcriptional regulator [Amnibacterium setariae]|uniref:TetR family transcriptional regulator n=1 Tax=Amnibacterium setariae TaxID=2306585 RepID=A0A3A1U244_9MICO|nr:TetR family transcriptional regulator [Amnibacterium setariae]RIX30522.1 TetR family transcriptional regulator [Amnibacterium setariae]
MDDASPGAERRGTRGPRPSRSRTEIVDAAVALADAGGTPALTLRATARTVGLAPAALYRYVATHEELVESAADRALEALSVPSPTGDRSADLVALARAQVAVLRRHPWLIDLLPTLRPGPVAIEVLDAGLGMLDGTPGGGAQHLETLALLTGVASLFARSAIEPSPRTIAALQAAAATHPRLAAAFAQPGRASAEEDLLERTVRALVGDLPAAERGPDDGARSTTLHD